MAIAAFAIQIYCDFSGYSDIARGCAKMMGITLMENFRAPYFARSIGVFWKRWHISLTNWFREYVYIPLGGNRKGLAKTLLLTVLVFGLSGLWHGAAWTYIVWGILHAGYRCCEIVYCRFCPQRKRGRIWMVFQSVWTFTLVCIAWVFFRATSLREAGYVLRYSLTGLMQPFAYIRTTVTYSIGLLGEIQVVFIILCVLLLLLYDYCSERRDLILWTSKIPPYVRWPVYFGFVLLLIFLIPKNEAAPFIYFQF